MKPRILFVERKFTGLFSLEKVFRQIAKNISREKFETAFQQAGFRSSVSGIFRNLLTYRPDPADIYHVTGDITYLALRLPPERTVLTIPDLSILKYRRGLRRFVLKKLLFDWPVRRARLVTAISEATRFDVLRETGCEPSKVKTIELPVGEEFVAPEKPGFNSDKPNILQVGTLPYKNLPRVVKALRGLDCTFTVIGDLDEPTRRLLDESGLEFKNESQLNDEQIREHYRRADMVVFCSVYEGFGLPIIEAQAMCTPVVTSNLSPMSDVAGAGALLVDPYNVESIRDAIISIIRDESLRTELVRKGSANVERFRPPAIAAKYEELYDSILGSLK